ncbi:hypothetical protein V474_02420 [Novosphingobium barchaimii LL02]|uniref:Uncharacterized protein n=1 Tax=Novosphingobium barchaimii LL02 TaxID=1114963 RepID=A0A0J7XJT9_9SPHN|nr:hypothetical protein [Novosphingobium barchaimii]KMS51919.1 hypothetical protein V474_02420 [Novosphingobium barchaimii LL02]
MRHLIFLAMLAGTAVVASAAPGKRPDFNHQRLAFVVHLGDFIDKDWKSYDGCYPCADLAYWRAEGDRNPEMSDYFGTLTKAAASGSKYLLAIATWMCGNAR